MNPEAGVWQSGTCELTFPSDHIDVWRVELDAPEPPEQACRSILAPDEAVRASRFHFERDRKRYTAGRAVLRLLLGRYLKMPPGEIRFHYESNGKPELAAPHDSRGLRFNVSNSGGLALIAFGSGRAIGIDVEKVRQMPDLLDIARRFFSTHEVQALLAIDKGEREEAFFACWTRKEAFLKATGVGLSYPLADFSVSVAPHAAAALLEIKGERDTTSRWFLTDVFPGAGYRGALASEGERRLICHWIFDPLAGGFC
jgi:4'-phosphopantetheinyl transferase